MTLGQDPQITTLLGEASSSTVDAHADADTSFTFSPSSGHSSSDTAQDYILDISKYIPVGCLRLQRYQCGIPCDIWTLSDSWAAFAHPRDVFNTEGGRYLPNKLQEQLFNSFVIKPYWGLHDSGWIRMEFKANDLYTGQARVYILPDDVGRRTINKQVRSLRRPMQQLLSQLDISKATWKGAWEDGMPVTQIDSSWDTGKQADASLFEIFNDLPSPDPKPESVADKYAKSAMYDILESNIKGLITTLYVYQRRSAAMMLQREAQICQLRDPRLRKLADQNGTTFYCDPDTGTCLLEPRCYDSDKGGILAENMGLGKTLISLALILSTRGMAPQIPIQYSVGTAPVRETTGSLLDMAAAKISRTGAPWMYAFSLDMEEYEFTNCAQAIQRNRGFYFISTQARRRQSRVVIPNDRKILLSDATIVVVPANLVKQWVQEINKHTRGLKVLVMSKGKDRLPAAEELAEYDIILFSRQRFDKEAQDGSDPSGRRTSTPKECNCPYIGGSRVRNCTCLKEQDIYHSPLKDLHFKRLITDEGHIFGNASKSSITDASTVVQFLQVTSRWIVSGTPTQGLYGTESSCVNSQTSSSSASPIHESDSGDGTGRSGKSATTQQLSNTAALDIKALHRQERKDLEKLGNIATMYLRVRPWANTTKDNDVAQWSHYVMQPRHGSKSHGNIHCLRSVLESMIIRNRPGDVEKDVVLPPLHQSIITLDGSTQDKLSLNIFSMMIISNAITSERKDADYLFHPRQRAALDLLVKNLRQASFHWSGFSLEDVKSTTDIAKDFLEKEKVPVSPEDKALLQDAIKVGEIVLSNNIKKASSQWHEMPMYIQNAWPEEVRAAWSLDGDSKNPTLMGATMVHSCQKFVERQLWKEDPMDGLKQAGKDSLQELSFQINPKRSSGMATNNNKSLKLTRKSDHSVLAGGIVVATVDEPSPVKRTRASSAGRFKPPPFPNFDLLRDSLARGEQTKSGSIKLKSAMKKSKVVSIKLDPASPLASTMLISTSSAKLTYLMQRIIVHQEAEKILVFYESENVAFYIAQALECLHIKHLIYAKTLPSDRKSQYVVTFNRTETFRVLLMDITQAAFGLDMSSASRVYFINPVFSPQVEAQAVKRAHRIGQTKPVFVETLILKGGIEEVILERRQTMSDEELKKCKNILNDQKIYDWIRNARFLPVPIDNNTGPDQMAKLDTPESVFGRGTSSTIAAMHNPDADLIMDSQRPGSKGKRKAGVAFEEEDNTSQTSGSTSIKKGKKAIAVRATSSSPHAETLDGENSRSGDRRLGIAFMEAPAEEAQRSQADDFGENEEDEGFIEFERFNRAVRDRPSPAYGDYPDLRSTVPSGDES